MSTKALSRARKWRCAYGGCSRAKVGMQIESVLCVSVCVGGCGCGCGCMCMCMCLCLWVCVGVCGCVQVCLCICVVAVGMQALLRACMELAISLWELPWCQGTKMVPCSFLQVGCELFHLKMMLYD